MNTHIFEIFVSALLLSEFSLPNDEMEQTCLVAAERWIRAWSYDQPTRSDPVFVLCVNQCVWLSVSERKTRSPTAVADACASRSCTRIGVEALGDGSILACKLGGGMDVRPYCGMGLVVPAEKIEEMITNTEMANRDADKAYTDSVLRILLGEVSVAGSNSGFSDTANQRARECLERSDPFPSRPWFVRLWTWLSSRCIW